MNDLMERLKLYEPFFHKWKSDFMAMSYDDMARSLGINSFVIKKMIPFVNMYEEEEIINKLMKLSDMDYDIKANGYDKDKVLEMFLIAL